MNNSDNKVMDSKISCKICLDECETLETGYLFQLIIKGKFISPCKC